MWGRVSLKQKLLGIIIIPSIISLGLTLAIVLVVNRETAVEELGKKLATTGELLARNSRAALAFSDQEVIRMVVNTALEQHPIIGAWVSAADGTVLAGAEHEKVKYELPVSITPRTLFRDSTIEVAIPVFLDKDFLGNIRLVGDKGYIDGQLEGLFLVMLVTFSLGITLSVILAMRLQSIVSAPILSLSATAKLISGSGDYSVQVRRVHDDEVGDLFDAFNKMLSHIHQRDQELVAKTQTLSATNERLREEIEERERINQELERLNVALELQTKKLHDEVKIRQKAEIEIEARNKDLQTLLYVTSHDLREPLRAILSFSKMVKDRYQDRVDEKGQDLLKRIAKAAERMDALILNVLTLSRARQMPVPTEKIPGDSLVDEALSMLHSRITATNATIRVDPELPDLKTDRFWGVQSLQNLIGNALKFTPEGVTPEIEIGAARFDSDGRSEIGLIVRDRGLGVPPEQAERIFGLFQRGVGRDIEGTGAGLAIVRQIAERHGGRAWVQPRPGGGSEFVVTFADR